MHSSLTQQITNTESCFWFPPPTLRCSDKAQKLAQQSHLKMGERESVSLNHMIYLDSHSKQEAMLKRNAKVGGLLCMSPTTARHLPPGFCSFSSKFSSAVAVAVTRSSKYKHKEYKVKNRQWSYNSRNTNDRKIPNCNTRLRSCVLNCDGGGSQPACHWVPHRPFQLPEYWYWYCPASPIPVTRYQLPVSNGIGGWVGRFDIKY